jgi:hypothetical protein
VPNAEGIACGCQGDARSGLQADSLRIHTVPARHSTRGCRFAAVFTEPQQQSNKSIMNEKPNHKHQNTRSLRHRLLAGSIGALLACSITAFGKEPTQEVGGTQTERVAVIKQLLTKSAALPGPLVDARCVQETTGDGGFVPGPSDIKKFYALKVAPADLPAWRAALAKSKPANTFSNDDEIKRAAPKKAKPWWVSAADLPKLEYFSPHSLTGNANGWVGIAPDGRIFIHVFTL